jgi:hypothetical protein
MLAFEPAGAAEDGLGVSGGGRAAGVIPGGQAVRPAVAEGAPEVTDGVEGDAEFGGDLRQGLAPEVSFDDVLSGGRRDGAWHGVSPDGLGSMSHNGIIP